jgi:hypothetical protein
MLVAISMVDAARIAATSCNGTFPTRRNVRRESGMRVKPDITASL